MNRNTASAVLLGLLTVLVSLDDSSAQPYPSKAAHIIAPAPVGGPGDIIAPGYNFTVILFQSSMTRSA